ncbi:MMPL family transporter [Corynebacterium frankenforstense]|uniref:MMPL family transporter n=1 Tax=Corynebacterium frankenforstense TaxID=1230998 RepID=UPI0009F971E6|nr:MMPL family transporter [Corynebacterium frankenforstense]
MSKFLYKVGRTAYRLKWPFLAVWLILLVAVAGLAGAFAKTPSDSFNIPGLQAVETQEKMQEYFPEAGDAINEPTGSVVIKAEDGTLADPENSRAVDALIEDLRDTGALHETEDQPMVNPVMADAGMRQQMTQQLSAQGVPEPKIEKDIAAVSPLSPDKTTGTIRVAFDAESSMDIPSDELHSVMDVLNEHNGQDGLEVSYNGNAFNGERELDMTSELIGLAVAALVLLVTFGSMVAAGMPLVTAVVGVALGVLGVRLCTAFSTDINEMTPTLASMIGLAVGIDYALFITSRFRNELIAAAGAYDTDPKGVAKLLRGLSRDQRAHAMGVATGTAGTSVVFAGTTVLIALAALSIINIPFLTAMALAAAATVAIAVLVAVTFLPALLGLMGTRAFAGRVPGPKVPDPEDEKPTMGLLWVRKVRAHPWLALGAGVIVLGLLAIPAANMRLAMPTDGSATLGSPQRTAYETTSDAFGDGRNAPMIALVEAPEDEGADADATQKNMAVYGQAVEDFSRIDGVENAQIVGVSEKGDAAQVLITPTGGATDEETSQTLVDLRAHEADFHGETGASYGITGATPIFDDMSERLADVLIPYIAIVLVLAFLVLMLVFRSIWVPLIAALGFGLSVAATFGVTVALFQEGWGGIVEDPQPLLSFLPIMLIGLVFGLAMDYEVFLVTRMREGYHRGKTAGNVTANGFKHGARVVTAAALIMTSVFAAFALQDMPFIKTMGFALAAAIVFDAFVVRMMIIPATMFLLGDRAWWLPKWIDRILPNIDIEGEGLKDLEPPVAASEDAAGAGEGKPGDGGSTAVSAGDGGTGQR